MIISGGENIRVVRIERVIYEMAASAPKVAVIGVPERALGRTAVAVVVLADGVALELPDLTIIAANGSRRSRYQTADHRDSSRAILPAKVLKRVLRAELEPTLDASTRICLRKSNKAQPRRAQRMDEAQIFDAGHQDSRQVRLRRASVAASTNRRVSRKGTFYIISEIVRNCRSNAAEIGLDWCVLSGNGPSAHAARQGD